MLPHLYTLVRKKATPTHMSNTCLIHTPYRTKQKLSRPKFQSSIKFSLILKLKSFLRHYSISWIKNCSVIWGTPHLPLPCNAPLHWDKAWADGGKLTWPLALGGLGTLVLFCSLELHMVLPKKPLLFKQLAVEMSKTQFTSYSLEVKGGQNL